MKALLLIFFIFLCYNSLLAQYYVENTLSYSLASATYNNTNCTSNRSLTIVVAGVGVLSSTNQLLEIELQLESKTRLSAAVYVKPPGSTVCYKIADKLGAVGNEDGAYGASGQILDYKFRAPNSCLNRQPDYTPSSTNTVNFYKNKDSRTGVFSTVTDISTVFNGINADGTWTFYFSSTVDIEKANLPTVKKIGLRFGSPLSIEPPNVNIGKTCLTSLSDLWDGEPRCYTTEGKNSGGIASAVSGCHWTTEVDNTVWIPFYATSSNICINISGIDDSGGTYGGVQSIIVEPTNQADPCAGTWKTINCPRDSIYRGDGSGTTGTFMSQNHCFNAVPGKLYFILVDGNAGTITKFFITGINGLPVILSAELIDFSYDCSDGLGSLKWQTATEENNDYFVIDYSKNGFDWYELGRKEASGNSKDIREYEYTLTQRFADGYFRLKQVDYDGTETLLQTIVATNCGQSKFNLQVVPNPSNGQFYILDANTYQSVQVVDMLGKEIYFNDQISDKSTLSIDLSTAKKGTYIISVVDTQGDKYIERLVIE